MPLFIKKTPSLQLYGYVGNVRVFIDTPKKIKTQRSIKKIILYNTMYSNRQQARRVN